MNKRIQELIGQAQKEVWGNCPYNGSPEFEGYELDAEKFAELIVRECVGLMEATLGQDKTTPFHISNIKQHFGVEE